MEKQETAEAIIVVGPFLWKCVNCDILMSRQHSIDHHLFHSHHSKLHPPAVSTTDDIITDCQISICSCQKLSKYHTHKRKRHNPPLKDPYTKIKKSSVSEHVTSLDDLTLPNESDVVGEGGEDEEEEENSFTQELWKSVDNSDEGLSNESLAKTMDDDLPIPDLENRVVLKDDKILMPNGDVPVLSCDSSELEEVETVTVSVPIVNSKTNGTEESAAAMDKHMLDGLRKSRRSNKGHNSLFKEYEMGNS